MIYRRFSSLSPSRRIARAKPRSIARQSDRYSKRVKGPVFYDTFSAVNKPVPSPTDPSLLWLSTSFVNTPSVGDYLKIDSEILKLENLLNYRNRIVVSRAHFGTSDAPHSIGASILSDQSQAITWYNSGYKVNSPEPTLSTANTIGWCSPLVDAGPSPNIAIAAGDLIKINNEIILINSVAVSANVRLEVTLGGRGYGGTTSAGHQVNDLIYVNHS